MAGPDVEVKSAAVRELMAAIFAKGQKPPLRRMSVIGVRSVLRNFRERGRPDRWRPLSRNTVANRRHGGDAPLQDSGGLRNSVHPVLLGRDNFKVTTRHPAAAFMQFGTKGPYIIEGNPFLAFRVAHAGPEPEGLTRAQRTEFRRGRGIVRARVVHPGVPARPFMMWQPEDVRDLERILLDHLLSGARR